MKDPFGTTVTVAKAWAQSIGLPAFRGEQIVRGAWSGRAERYADIAVLPRDLAERLDGTGPLLPGREVVRQESNDGTVKSLLELHDGKRVECVSIPTEDRHTICVSSQVGCAVGCTFCASGQRGVERDLTAGEIAYQVLHHHRKRPVTNVVFMGSGEPFFNYDNVIGAIRVLADPALLGMGRRRFTVSTSGVPQRIRQLGTDEPQVTLALSLHAPDDDTRSRLVPLNKRWPVAELMSAMQDYSSLVNRRITLEYVCLADANLQDTQANGLADVALRFNAHINLIPFNPVTDAGHRRPTREELGRFIAILDRRGASYTVRGQRGDDIDAACGQLLRRAEQTAPPASPEH